MAALRRHGWVIGAAVIGAAAVVAAALALHATATTSVAAPAADRVATSDAAAASRFALAYIEVLDGRARPAALPVSSPAVRRTAASVTVPASARAGALAVSALTLSHPVARAVKVQAVARDSRHSYPFDFTVSHLPAGWIVSGLIPPDVGEVLRPTVSRAFPALPGTQPVVSAAALAYERRHGHPRAAVTGLIYSPLQAGVLPVTVALTGADTPKLTVLLRRSHGRGWRLWQVWRP